MELPVNKIVCGDCLEVMRAWPSESVDCCVTSPPYWGLRDYGTATWEGGDADCDHKEAKQKTRYDYSLASSKIQDGSRTGTDATVGSWKDVCPKCGAKRIDRQLGLEKTPEEYVAKMVEIFAEVKRVLKDGGTLWLNLGDSYAGSGKGSNPDGTPHPATLTGKQGTHKGTINGLHFPQKASDIGLKPKDLCGIPWMVAFALRADGWYLRQDIIWAKPNPMPESVIDRCTKAHEYIFLMSKKAKYYCDMEAIKENSVDPESHNGRNKRNDDKFVGQPMSETRGGFSKIEAGTTYPTRNKRSVWTVATKPYSEAHFATFPPDLITPCVLAGCPKGGVILDPFMGSGTTAVVSAQNGRNYVGCELNPEYINLGRVEATETGVPVKESRAGQLALFKA